MHGENAHAFERLRREQGSGQAKQLWGLLTTRGEACVMAALAIG